MGQVGRGNLDCASARVTLGRDSFDGGDTAFPECAAGGDSGDGQWVCRCSVACPAAGSALCEAAALPSPNVPVVFVLDAKETWA